MNIEKINDNSQVTKNFKQLEVLKKHFPECFDKNGAFIIQKMEEIVNLSETLLSKESYTSLHDSIKKDITDIIAYYKNSK
ncbi:MAG: hypothetical protein HXX81_03355, partial [Campylobacterales bacterium]|nr:hypothetical protein [Campylobacterales bacterium]